jgi:hypothetical protein
LTKNFPILASKLFIQLNVFQKKRTPLCGDDKFNLHAAVMQTAQVPRIGGANRRRLDLSYANGNGANKATDQASALISRRSPRT